MSMPQNYTSQIIKPDDILPFNNLQNISHPFPHSLHFLTTQTFHFP